MSELVHLVQFRDHFDRHRVHSNVGSRERILYQSRFDEHGSLELVESGREDLYGYIQSHRDSVDLHKMLERYRETGDVADFQRRAGMYGDFTVMPKTYAELLNTVLAGEQYFESLPLETREKFDHSFQKFMASMDKPDFAEKMGFSIQETPAETPTPAPSVEKGETAE